MLEEIGTEEKKINMNNFKYTVVVSNDTDPSWLLGCYATKKEAVDAMIEDVMVIASEDVDKSAYKQELLKEYETDIQLNRAGWWYYVCELTKDPL